MLTDKQIDEIDYLAAGEKHWSNWRYNDLPLKPDTVRTLTTELKRQRRLMAAVREAWLDEGEHAMQHREASAWVRANWPSLASDPRPRGNHHL